jgi:hypothetical protein
MGIGGNGKGELGNRKREGGDGKGRAATGGQPADPRAIGIGENRPNAAVPGHFWAFGAGKRAAGPFFRRKKPPFVLPDLFSVGKNLRRYFRLLFPAEKTSGGTSGRFFRWKKPSAVLPALFSVGKNLRPYFRSFFPAEKTSVRAEGPGFAPQNRAAGPPPPPPRQQNLPGRAARSAAGRGLSGLSRNRSCLAECTAISRRPAENLKYSNYRISGIRRYCF